MLVAVNQRDQNYSIIRPVGSKPVKEPLTLSLKSVQWLHEDRRTDTCYSTSLKNMQKLNLKNPSIADSLNATKISHFMKKSAMKRLLCREY